MITLINTTATGDHQESVLFQTVLKAYPTHHSWMITAHISLGSLECHWKPFTRQMDRTRQLLQSLCQQPSAPHHLISPLQAELTNLNDIYTSYKPLILAATNLLDREPSFNGTLHSKKCLKESLLTFLCDALSLAHRNCHH